MKYIIKLGLNQIQTNPVAGKTCNYAGQKPATLTMNYALITRVRRYITVSGEGGHLRPFPDASDLRHAVDEDWPSTPV